MRRFAIRLALPLALLITASQFVIPPFAEDKVADRVTEHGGEATVDLKAVPAVRLLFGHGSKLDLKAHSLSVDLEADQQEVFDQLDDFGDVDIDIRDSRAGPFTVAAFRVRKAADRIYDVAIAGDGTAGDVARYAGGRLGGGFGQALAGLAASALGGFDRPIPFDATMQIVTQDGATPAARDVRGQVDGLPAGPLAQVVANALLSGL
jgi:hypothetical protein